MNRRSFLRAFGVGAAGATAATAGIAHAQDASELQDVPHDLAWAKDMVNQGHRVRPVSWREPLKERAARPLEGPELISFRFGSPGGVSSLDNLAITPEMVLGPWEIVPEEDYPEPVREFQTP